MDRFDILLEKKQKWVYYRRVLNDAVVGNWEPVKEINPPTIRGLVGYLKTAGIDFKMLEPGRTWDGSIVDWGLRDQFKLPEQPTSEDLEWLERRKSE